MIMLEYIEENFRVVVLYGVLVFEAIGVVILLLTAVKCVYAMLRRRGQVRLSLAEGIALALEFKLGGEVLRTVVVRATTELITLGAIIALRAALTFLIHWEIKHERANLGNGENK